MHLSSPASSRFKAISSATRPRSFACPSRGCHKSLISQKGRQSLLRFFGIFGRAEQSQFLGPGGTEKTALAARGHLADYARKRSAAALPGRIKERELKRSPCSCSVQRPQRHYAGLIKRSHDNCLHAVNIADVLLAQQIDRGSCSIDHSLLEHH